MNAQIALQLFFRLIPSLICFVAAFYAVKDASVRERWANLLFKAGSIRADQKADPKIQNGVRIPFFGFAVLFLAWPAYYLLHDSYAQGDISVIVQPTPIPRPTPTPVPLPGSITPGPTPFGTPPAVAGISSAPAPVNSGAAPVVPVTQGTLAPTPPPVQVQAH